ncbi:MAG: hypothetical protein P8183_12700 [Anaerolineae bacterium]
MVVVNIGDDQAEVDLDYNHQKTMVTNLRGKLEMELAQLSAEGDEESLAMFMDEYGVTELSLDKVIRLSYDLMGLQSFFTVGGVHPRRNDNLRRLDGFGRIVSSPQRRQTAPGR